MRLNKHIHRLCLHSAHETGQLVITFCEIVPMHSDIAKMYFPADSVALLDMFRRVSSGTVCFRTHITVRQIGAVTNGFFHFLYRHFNSVVCT